MTSFHSCPRCGTDGSVIGAFGSYFQVYACDACAKRFCSHCKDTNGARECPCGSTKFHAIGRVHKTR